MLRFTEPRSANDAAPTGLGILLFLVSTKMPRRWCWKPQADGLSSQKILDTIQKPA
jgi:hypothetical protein